MDDAARGLSAALARARGDAPAWAHRAYQSSDGRILIIDERGSAWLACYRERREATSDGSAIIARLIPVFGPVPVAELGIEGRDEVNRGLIATVRALRKQQTLKEIEDGLPLE